MAPKTGTEAAPDLAVSHVGNFAAGVHERIVFLGGGNMASALIGGLSRQGVHSGLLAVVDIAEQARERHARAGIATFRAPSAELAGAPVWVLAVKPDMIVQACGEAAPHIPDGATVVSIAAGIAASTLAGLLGDRVAIVRAMPNTPAIVGLGLAGLYAAPEVGVHHRARAQALFDAVGASIWLRDEAMMDAITAVGGSGPAYVYYFMEAVQRSAREFGFAEPDARRLAIEVFRGAAELAARDDAPLETLRARVTSKGGTTQAAMAALQDANVGSAIRNALEHARRRAGELAQGAA